MQALTPRGVAAEAAAEGEEPKRLSLEAAPLTDLFSFGKPDPRKLLLDPASGLPAR